MSIEIIQTQEEFLQLKDNWNSLLSRSASHVPFLRHEFISTWWRNLGGGEWQSGELQILIQRDSKQNLTGIAPMFLTDGKLLLIGSHEISDYLDLITPEDNIEFFTSEIIRFLLSGGIPEWNELDLYNLPEGTPTIKYLEDAGVKAGCEVFKEIIQPAPSIQLPSSWEDYLGSLDERYRNEILRKIRNAESYFLPIEWHITENQDTLESDLDDFFDLMADNQEKSLFLTDSMRVQIKESALAASQENWLQLAFLTVGGIRAAGYLNFDYQGVIWVYNSGINSTFENISPGWVLLTRIIEWAIQEGKTTLDFMRGDEAYKYQFGGKDKHVVRLRIIAP